MEVAVRTALTRRADQRVGILDLPPDRRRGDEHHPLMRVCVVPELVARRDECASELRRIGEAGRARVLGRHTSDHRAAELEALLSGGADSAPAPLSIAAMLTQVAAVILIAAAAVHPGDDFFAFANSEWLEATEFPAGSKRWTARNEINDLTRQHAHDPQGERILRRKSDPILGEACKMLDLETRRCTIYDARPLTCREFPARKRCAYYDLLTFERSQQNDRTVLPLVQITFRDED